MKPIIRNFKQRLLPAVLVLLATLLPTTATAYDFMVDGLCYNINSDGKTVTVTNELNTAGSAYSSLSGAVIIPPTVTNGDTEYQVTTIGNDAFMQCLGITSVTIPSTVTEIGSGAFWYCKNLSRIEIPNSVTKIGYEAFHGTEWYYRQSQYQLDDVIYAGLVAYSFKNDMPSNSRVFIKSGTKGIASGAFYKCAKMASVIIPSSVITIGDEAFNGCSNISHISCKITEPENCTLGDNVWTNVPTSKCVLYVPHSTVEHYCALPQWQDFTNIISADKDVITFADEKVERICVSQWDSNKDGFVSYNEAASVTSIKSSIFSSNKNITSFDELQYFTSLSSISAGAFDDCSGLTSIIIPNSVTSIGNDAFRGCSGLISVVIGNSVTSIDNEAFYNCSSLTEITIPNSVTSVGSSAFCGCNSLTTVSISNSLNSIADKTFYGCFGLTSVTIPSSVVSIGSEVFSGCSNLTSIQVERGNTVYDSRDNCNAIIKTESNSLIVGCKNSIIPNSVTSIGQGAFQKCSSLTSITIPSSVTSIGNNAFADCSGLTSVTIPNWVTSISSAAFSGCCGLTSVTWNAKRCADFSYAYNFNYPYPNFVHPFDDCPISILTIGGEVEYLPATFMYAQKSLTSVTIPNSVTEIGKSTFSGCSNLTSVTIGNSVSKIGNYAFDSCSNLTSVTIGNSVSEIGYYAFNGCSNLTSVIWDARNCKDLLSDTDHPFAGCPISELLIGNEVESLPANFMYANKSLTSVTIPGSVTKIGSSAFYGCSSLNSATIPNSVTEIGDYAFSGCNGLTSVTFPNSVTEIGNSTFHGCSGLTSVTIPGSVTKIGSSAFYGCSGLAKIISWPLYPPSLGSYCFDGVDKSIPIYVSNIEDYETAAGWKEFTNFQPLGASYKKLTVELPADFGDGRYKGCYIEVDNADGSTHHRCLVTDKQSYTFNLSEDATYNVTVKNALGVVLGEKVDVTIAGDETIVAFDSLKQPHEVSLAVTLPDGEDVTDRVAITWMLGDTFIGQGPDLPGTVEGIKLTYELKLPSDLATSYVQPQPTEYTVDSSSNSILVKLQPFGKATLTGTVVDATEGTPLALATVTLSQTLNGSQSRSVTARTDGKGYFELEAFTALGQLTVSASGYISTTVDVTSAEGATAIGTLRLAPITGVTVNTSFTHRGSVKAGESTDTENFYADYANVAYTVRNKTQGREIKQYSVQYPEIVLLEDVDDGDELEVTARSLTDAFADVTASCSVADNRAAVTLPIVDYGGVVITVNEMDATSAVGMLYDGSGEQSRRGTFSGGALQFDNLPDGDYTLVAMQQNTYLNGVLTLDGLSTAGLRPGTDFARQNVTVRSGVISEVSLARISALDESVVQYTGSNTHFSPNATSTIIGKLVVLTARVDFKNAYRDKTKNVSLFFDLPQGCEFVEQSVLVDNKVASYTRDGQRVIVSVPAAGGQVKFCATPTISGEVRPSAAVQLSLDGNSVTQPIGTAAFEAKALDIKVPALTATPDIAISGTAPSGSDINIYDNGEFIGATTATAGGAWNTRCTLVSPYNLSSHQVSAKIITKNGVELLSQSAECVIDRDVLQVSKVTMYYNNSWDHNTYKVIFDYLNPTTTAQTWSYYPGDKKFTFTIEFTDNNPSKISDVVLYVKTANSGWHSIKAVFDEHLELWVAAGEMSSGDSPENVSVDYVITGNARMSAEVYDAAINSNSTDGQAFKEDMSEVDSLMEQLNKAWDNDDHEAVEALKQRLIGIASLSLPETEPQEYSIEDLLSFLEKEEAAEGETFDPDNLFNQSYEQISELSKDIRISSCEGFTVEQLLAEGFERIEKDNGSFIYFFANETVYKVADFENNIYYEADIVDEESGAPQSSMKSFAKSEEDFETQMDKCREVIKKRFKKLVSLLSTFADLIQNLDRKLDIRNGQLANTIHYTSNRIEYLENKRINSGLTSEESRALRRYRSLYKKRVNEAVVNAKILGWLDRINTAELRVGTIRFSGKTAVRVGNGVLTSIDLVMLMEDMVEDISNVLTTYHKIPKECKNEQANADALRRSVEAMGIGAGLYYTAHLVSDAAQITLAITGATAALPSGGTSLSAVGIAFGLAVANMVATAVYEKNFDRNLAKLSSEIDNLACVKKDPNLKNLPTEPAGEKYPGSVLPRVLIDPSGYVYEAVPSNRLQGATATIYYKETVEDMWGQSSEQEVMWDAEEYAQRNPLFTDENGMYQWDVPQGLWQVRFAKQGYEPAQSEWLPVPPPQLDVNIGMTQLRQPEVAMVHAYSDGVELTFDKYMRPSTLTTDNIRLTYKDKAVASTIELLNAEQGDSENYASKVRIVPATEFADGEVMLTVLPAVESYAGVTMNSTFEQSFGIERQIRVIAVDSVLNVGYGESREVKVRVLPLDIAAGKTLLVNSNQPMIASIEDGAAVTLDDHGKATLTVTGNLPGATTMTLNVDGFDLQQQAHINVVDESTLVTATPVASAWNGKVFDKAFTLELSCETDGAEIWYTLDGSCPCDPETRVRYTGPITIDSTTTLKVIAQAPGHYESDIATYYYFQVSSVSDVQDGTPFTLRVQDGALVVNGLKRGPCEMSVYSLNGAEVMRHSGVHGGERVDVSHLPQGVYVVVVIADGRPTAVRIML